MRKSEALELLGGSIPAAADAIGVTYQAVDKWPDELPQRIADRVQAALWRKSQGVAAPSAMEPADAQPVAAELTAQERRQAERRAAGQGA